MTYHSRLRDNSFGDRFHRNIADDGSSLVNTNFIQITDLKINLVQGILEGPENTVYILLCSFNSSGIGDTTGNKCHMFSIDSGDG